MEQLLGERIVVDGDVTVRVKRGSDYALVSVKGSADIVSLDTLRKALDEHEPGDSIESRLHSIETMLRQLTRRRP